MTYDEFLHVIIEGISELVDEDIKVSARSMIKNNGYERKGITFARQGDNVSPTIYLEEYYERWKRGCTVMEIAHGLVETYEKVKTDQNWSVHSLTDYEKVKDKIIYKLVNRKKNQEMLAEVPHVEYLDLVILFYVLVDAKLPEECMSMMLIRKEQLDMWNTDVDALYKLASRNTERLLPGEFAGMYAVVQSLLGLTEADDEDCSDMQEENMYVLTNHLRNCGASAMLYHNRLERIGDYLGENYYILPSSIHEVILLPESQALTKDEMNRIVIEVNETHVPTEDFLSDHVYYYDREKREVLWGM